MNDFRSEALTGSFLAFAVGDALGWPMEGRGNRVGGTRDLKPELVFREWRRREGGRFAPREETIPAGTYSDDTQLTLAVARSLRSDDWWAHWTRTELPWWTQYQLGGGGATRRAAQAWAKGRPPWLGDDAGQYWSAGGNGVAMRVLAHATAERFEPARDRVLADGAATHGHPIALVSAQAYAFALWLTLRRGEPLGWGQLLDEVLGEVGVWAQLTPEAVPDQWARHLPDDYSEQWARTVESFVDLLQFARNELAHGALAVGDRVLDQLGSFSKQSGAGTITTAAALYLASRHAAEPRQGLLRAAFARGADTDTLAAMTGALLGAVHGPQWLGPITDQVMDADLLRRSAEQAGQPATTETRPFQRSALRAVERELAGIRPGAELELPFYGLVTVHDIRDLDNRTTRIRSWWMRNREGQTFRITRTSKATKALPWVTLTDRGTTQDEPDTSATARGSGGKQASEKAANRREPSGSGQETPRPEQATGVGPPKGEQANRDHQKHSSDQAKLTDGPKATTTLPLRSGLVVRVRDLKQSRDFYESLLGMPVSRTTRSALVLGGWLALEAGAPARDRQVHASVPFAVTLYAAAEALAAAETRLQGAGIPYRISETERGRALLTNDPDGIPVNICPS